MKEENTAYQNLGKLSSDEVLDFQKTFVYGMCRGLFEVDNGIAIIADGYSTYGNSCEYFMLLSDGTECYVKVYNYDATVYYSVCRLCPYSKELNDGFRSIYDSIELVDDSKTAVEEDEVDLDGKWEEKYYELQLEYEKLQLKYDELLAEHEEQQKKYEELQEEKIISEENSMRNEEETDSSSISIYDMIQSQLMGVEKNTNEAHDKIIEMAKRDAENATDKQINEAISAIRDNYPQYYNGPEQMELYMYYGYLLDYAFGDSDPRSELGMDICQAIKYVYRGHETVLDSATKANLDQIEKDLQKIR